MQYLPTTFYISREGTIVDKMTGLLDRKDIEQAVKKTLNASSRPVNVQQNQARADDKSAAMKTLEAKQPSAEYPSMMRPTDR